MFLQTTYTFRVDIWAERGISRSHQEVEGKRPTRLRETEDRWILQTQVPEPNQNMSTRDKQEIQHTETSTLDLSVCDVVTISPFMADFQSNRSNSF